MEINLSDSQWKLLLETLGKAHTIEYMQGKDNSSLEELIKVVAEALNATGKSEIFSKVFQEIKKKREQDTLYNKYKKRLVENLSVSFLMMKDKLSHKSAMDLFERIMIYKESLK